MHCALARATVSVPYPPTACDNHTGTPTARQQLLLQKQWRLACSSRRPPPPWPPPRRSCRPATPKSLAPRSATVRSFFVVERRPAARYAALPARHAPPLEQVFECSQSPPLSPRRTDFCNFKCGLYNTTAGETGAPENLTLYRITPFNTSGIRNKNTGDAAGDVNRPTISDESCNSARHLCSELAVFAGWVLPQPEEHHAGVRQGSKQFRVCATASALLLRSSVLPPNKLPLAGP